MSKSKKKTVAIRGGRGSDRPESVVGSVSDDSYMFEFMERCADRKLSTMLVPEFSVQGGKVELVGFVCEGVPASPVLPKTCSHSYDRADSPGGTPWVDGPWQASPVDNPGDGAAPLQLSTSDAERVNRFVGSVFAWLSDSLSGEIRVKRSYSTPDDREPFFTFERVTSEGVGVTRSACSVGASSICMMQRPEDLFLYVRKMLA